MAFPVIATAANSTEGSNTTSHTVSLPTVFAGDLLIASFVCDSNPTITWASGWTKLAEEDGPAGANRLEIHYREADGTEGASITVTTSASQTSAHICYRITGAEDPDTQAPEASASAEASSDNPDSASLSPSGGAADFLWLTIEGNDTDRSVSVFPTNYTDGEDFQASGGQGCGVGIARRNLNATSENPGEFTLSAQDQWAAFTVAIHPTSAPPAARGWPWKVIDSSSMVQYKWRQ